MDDVCCLEVLKEMKSKIIVITTVVLLKMKNAEGVGIFINKQLTEE